MADDGPERQAVLMEAKAALTQDIQAWADKFALTPEEVLALCAYITGSVIAVQDQRTMTQDRALEIVRANMKAGNVAVVDAFLAAPGGHA